MEQTIVKENIIAIYDDKTMVGVGVRCRKTGKTVLYRVEELGFDGVFSLLEDIAGGKKIIGKL